MYSQVTVKKVSSVKAGGVQATSVRGGTYSKVSAPGYASSVYAGAGGLGTRISSTSGNVVFAGGHLSFRSQENRIFGHEKQTMQNLNERLASYLENVQSLEKSNAELEAQIRDWYSKNTESLARDDGHYFQVIKDLRDQVLSATVENASVLLQIDNTRLAAEDFRIKFESEQAFCAAAEKDTCELRKVIDQLTLAKADLESQIENVNEELAFLKKNHIEEITELHKRSGGAIEVEVDVAPTANLGKVMEDMREQYEKMIEKQRLEAKYWFEKKVEECNEEVHINTTELENSRKELKALKQTVQTLEIESQAEVNKKNAANVALDNINAQYAIQLAEAQERITHIETLHQQTRRDVNHQISEFTLLLSLKSQLEAEIATYRNLLDGGTSLIPK
ncbi:keratin, type I cytoskeletal 19-like [Hyperolius riggenbachi]|uniref:keratin, type I cytoskeletal 19-like n=1 Tax=Hyperolius riggenbachi TaxID=752182 RepID=UPI0035A32711